MSTPCPSLVGEIEAIDGKTARGSRDRGQTAVRQTAQDVTVEKGYYGSSLAPDPKQLAYAIRGHWKVENRLHWCLAVTFQEDACRTHCDHVP